MNAAPRFAAVVLAGGRASRLGGVDKGSVEVNGRTLVARAVDACVDADETVVVGPVVPTERPVTFTVEDPRFGGPVAALLTGREALTPAAAALGTLVVLAVDMPFLDAGTLRRLRLARVGRDGAVLVDDAGRRQPVLALDTAALDAVAPDREARHGRSLRSLLEPLDLAPVPATGPEARDVDTWADLRDVAELSGGTPAGRGPAAGPGPSQPTA